MVQTVANESTWIRASRQDRGQQTAERILLATEQLMAKRPFREISVAEIVREAKASQSSFYARFPDKSALLGCIYERYSQSQMEFVDAFMALERWRDVPLALGLRQVFPMIVAGYQSRQGLIRAFLELASSDERFRKTWSEIGSHIVHRVKEVVLARRFEVQHPDPSKGVEHGLSVVFGSLAHLIQMHQLDSPMMEERVEELILIMLRYMGIPDVASGPSDG